MENIKLFFACVFTEILAIFRHAYGFVGSLFADFADIITKVFTPVTDFFNFLYERCFATDLSGIQNFETADIQRFLPFLIVGVCAGVFIAVCSSYYVNHYLGQTVRALYKNGAFSPENAKSLDEIGLNKPLIRRSLYRSTIVSKYVKPTEPMKNRNSAKTAAFYIKEEDKYIADKRFKEARHGILTIVITFFLCFFASFGLLFIIPELLVLADNAITLIKG